MHWLCQHLFPGSLHTFSPLLECGNKATNLSTYRNIFKVMYTCTYMLTYSILEVTSPQIQWYINHHCSQGGVHIIKHLIISAQCEWEEHIYIELQCVFSKVAS